MAFIKFCILIAIIATLVSSIMAKEFIVGDDKGWTTNFDYQSWAAGKEFFVGDKLVFKYPLYGHNVFRVNGTSFQQCIKPGVNEALVSGNDVITLSSEGRKWYICGVGKHCESGNQKLFITVMPRSMSPWSAPSSSPISSAPKFMVTRYYQLIGAFFVVLLLITV